MNNNGYFMTGWLFLWNSIIKNSFLYKLLCSIYAFISSQWQNSCITNLFRKTFFSENTAKSSLWGKLCFLPFLLLEKIQVKYAEQLNVQKEKSSLLRFFKYLLHNCIALNLRFLGVLIFSASVTYIIVAFFFGGNLTVGAVLLVLGAAMYFANINVTALLKESLLIKLTEKCLDTTLSFNFFYITKCEGSSRLFCAVFFGIVSGFVAALISPLLGIALVPGLVFVFLVFYKAEFGVFSTIFLAPILPTMAVVGLCLLCLLSLAVKILTTKKFTLHFEGIGLMVIMMLGIYLVGALTSFAPFKSLQIWAVYFAFMIFYFVVINTLKTKKQLFDLLRVFTLSGVAVCLYGILQYVLGWNVDQAWMDTNMFSDIKMRIYSTLGNPNVLGEFILLVLPACITLIWTAKKALPRLVYTGFALILGLALILTFSRGCWLGIMAAASIFITFVAGKLWGLALIALPVLPFVIPQSIINRFTSIGDMSDSSTSYRVAIWMGTIQMLKDFWLSGIGLGTEAFIQVYPFYSYNMVVAQHPHNLFLLITTETGIVGIAVFLLLVFLFFKKMTSGFLVNGKAHPVSIAIVGISSAIAGFLLQGMFDNCFYNYKVFMLFWSVIAIGSAAISIAKSESTGTEAVKNA